MANHPNRNGKFELTFVGGASADASRVLGRYRRKFASVEEVKNRALDQLADLIAMALVPHAPQSSTDPATVPMASMSVRGPFTSAPQVSFASSCRGDLPKDIIEKINYPD
jgi:hypothetical protein